MVASHNPFLQADGKKPTCMEMLQSMLDNEVTDEQKVYFMAHMDGCMPCFKSYNIDMAIKELVKKKCCNGVAPNDLIEKIKSKIALL